MSERSLSARELRLLLGDDSVDPEPVSILPPDFTQEPYQPKESK